MRSQQRKKGTILFVHGAWHGAWCWEKYFVGFFEKEGYHCEVFNLPGHDTPGEKSKNNTLRLRDYVKALRRKVFRLEETPIIIGHSMGGMVLQKYLETASCRMAILLAPVPPTGVLRAVLRFLRKPYTYASLFSFNLYHLVNTPKKAQWAFFSQGLPQDELEEYTSQLCGASFTVFLDLLYPDVQLNYQNKIPMLVLAAEQDNIFTVRDNKITAAKYSADFTVIKGIAHDMMLDVGREKVMMKINRWIDSQSS